MQKELNSKDVLCQDLFDKLEANVCAKDDELTKAMDHVESLTQDIAKLETELSDCVISNEAKAMEIRALQGELKSMEKELESKEAASQELFDQLEANMSAKEDEVNDLKLQVESLSHDSTRPQTASNEGKTVELRAFHDEPCAKDKQDEVLRDQLEASLAQVDALSKETTELQADLDAEVAANRETTAEMSKLQQQRETAAQMIQSKEEKIVKLKSKVTTLSRQGKELSKAVLELCDWKSNAEKEMASTEEEFSSFKDDVAREIAQKVLTIDQLTEELVKAREEGSSLQSQIDEERLAGDAMLGSESRRQLDATLLAKAEEVDQLKMEAKRVSEDASEVQSQLNSKLDAANEELGLLKRWKTKAEEHLETAASKIQSLEEQLKAKDEDIASSLEAKEGLDATILAKEDELKQSKLDAAKLRDELKAAGLEKETVAAEMTLLRDRLQEASSAINQLTMELEVKAEKIQALEQRLENEIEQANSQNELLQDKLKTLDEIRAICSDQKDEIARLHQDLATAEKTLKIKIEETEFYDLDIKIIGIRVGDSTIPTYTCMIEIRCCI